VQGHFARLSQSGGLYLFAGASSSVNRTRVPSRLWTRDILVSPRFASRAVDQTRPLPPYSEPHSRLIEPERHAAHASGLPPGASSALSIMRFPPAKARPWLEVVSMSSRFFASAAVLTILAASQASAAADDQRTPAGKPQKFGARKLVVPVQPTPWGQ
jgi:hypothetical protein